MNQHATVVLLTQTTYSVTQSLQIYVHMHEVEKCLTASSLN